MNLVIIEGAGKLETIKKYLGSDYEVVATKGHIRDLPVKKLGVNVLKNFEPEYEIMSDKKDIVKLLKSKAEKATNILLATDPDREGEAIAWHLAHILGLDINKNIRIVFNEISKNAVTKAIDKARPIDLSLVDAQQARRVLDRLVGYKLSPVLCKKIQSNLSGGRVQSVALKLIVERENAITEFKPKEYWNVSAMNYKDNTKEIFKSALIKYKNKKYEAGSAQEVEALKQELAKKSFVVKSVKKSVGKTHAPAPYITSTMQQDASTKLGFSLKKTSSCAQQLYEGVSIEGEGKVALVTYIRTDSVRVAPEAMNMAKDYIIQNFGEKYYPKTPNVYSKKALTQDAHEAIRPISLEQTPEKLKSLISTDNYKLYKMIYERFLASQMAESTYNSVIIEIDNGDYTFKATGRTPLFDGFTIAYAKNSAKSVNDESENEEKDESLNDKIPELNEGDVLTLHELKTEQKFTKPPLRYTEGTLVKEMEAKGIGRPATYAATFSTLSTRRYIDKDGKYIFPTELGYKIIELLTKYFSDIINVKFTAEMEDSLDNITEKHVEWQNLIKEFYKDFETMLKEADQDYTSFKPAPKESDEVCDKCGSPMLIRMGRYGEFLACSSYPNCKNIKSLNPPKEVGTCPKCKKPIYEKTSKKGYKFYGCSGYPECDFISWEIPMNESCPKCSNYLTYKMHYGDKKIKCSNTECDYTNVIKKNEIEK